MDRKFNSLETSPPSTIKNIVFYSRSLPRNCSIDLSLFGKHSGRYQDRSTSDIPSLEFSRSPRFFGGNLDSVIKYLSLRRKRENSIINKNKECVNQYKTARKLRLEEHSCQLEARIEQSRRMKELFFESKHKQLQFNLNQKMRKFNLRRRESEIVQIKKSWVLLSTIIGAVSVLAKKSQNRKRLQTRAEKLLNWFYQIAKCLGRTRIIIGNNRIKRAKRTLRLSLIDNIQNWRRKKRTHLLEAMVSSIETPLTTGVLVKLLSKWKCNILTIQRSLRMLILHKRKVNKYIIDLWNSIGSSNCPDEIKLIYVRPIIHRSIMAYTELYDKHKKETREIKALNYNEQDRRGLLNSQGILVLPKKPIPFSIEQIITLSLLKEIKVRAERERIYWKKQMKRQYEAIRKSYKRVNF